MVRAVMVIAVSVVLGSLAVACTDPPPFVEPPILTDEVEHLLLHVGGPRQIDLLFVIDSSPAMAPYAARLAANAPDFVGVLATLQGGLPSLHMAVTTATGDGQLRTDAAVAGTFLSDVAGSGGTRTKDYSGELRDVFGRLARVGTDGPTERRPIAASVQALAEAPGFARPDAQLVVAILAAGDDGSPGDLAAAAAGLKALKRDPGRVIVGVVAPPSATRLHAFADQFPNRSSVTTIDQEDWSGVLQHLAGFPETIVDNPCFGARVTTECLVESSAFGQIPRCPGSPACYSIEVDPVVCPGGGHQRIRFDADWAALPEWATVFVQCEVE